MIAPGGRLVALAASRKVLQWPPTLGVGTVFEACADEKLLTEGAAIATSILGCGLFELELIRESEGFSAIDLNPRAYGQIRFEAETRGRSALPMVRMCHRRGRVCVASRR